jgi:type IV pilus assembly protein PilF
MKRSLICILLLVFFISACTSVSRDQSRLAEALQHEGEVLLMQGNHTAALAKLLEALKITPHDPFLHNSLGLAYMGKNRNDLAESSFQKALDLKPDYTQALNNLGTTYLRQKKWDPAISAFKKVLDDLLYPTPQFPLSNLGWAHLGKKEYEQAKVWFLQSLDVLPCFVTASHGLARVFLDTRRPDLAINFLTTCLRRIPEAAILHADLAQSYEAIGQTDQARQSWEKVLAYANEDTALAKTARDRLAALD